MKSMMKKMTSLLLLIFVFIGLVGCQKVDDSAEENPSQETSSEENASDDKEASDVAVNNKAEFEQLKDGEEFHIGLVTSTVSQSEDEFRGAEAAIEKYGKASEGGVIVHDTYPDQFETLDRFKVFPSSGKRTFKLRI